MNDTTTRRRWWLTLPLALFLVAGATADEAGHQHDHSHEHQHEHALEPDLGAPPEMSLYQLDATWRDDRDHARQLAELKGRPVVLSMIYTSCEYVCPLLVQEVRAIDAALPEDLQDRAALVLVSFDPERDTPRKLAAYRDQHGLPADHWTLLTGDPDDVLTLAAVIGMRYRPDGRGDFAHSNLVTILDREGVIRHQQVGIGQGREASTEMLRTLLAD